MINSQLYILLLLCVSILSSCAISSQPLNNSNEKRPEKFIMADDFLDKGVAQYNQFHYEQAGVFFMKALYFYRSIDAPKGIITACINLAKTSLSMGDIDKAEKFIKSAKKVVLHSPEIRPLKWTPLSRQLL